MTPHTHTNGDVVCVDIVIVLTCWGGFESISSLVFYSTASPVVHPVTLPWMNEGW